MGHVPRSRDNRGKMRGDADPMRFHAKDNLLITTETDMPGYSGHKPRSLMNDTGRERQPNLEMTTSGRHSKYVMEDQVETAMNKRDHAKGHATKSFFSRGGGEDSSLVADLYFQRYRPFEGYMKHGSKTEQKWVSDSQLFRTHIAHGGAA
eukprot:NODE_6763_length_622_cov_14.157576_g6740_i0.p1 GENE.NODE_6763_length_622_cov_14.157576_g6740_i0~~NODE_6763_length_622_cov_14.157576_g6740_i0.p1  ORF type:complete len:164 (+),score=37.02 NODE_6763_length_622_cov_14.157576_g6740_i0:44-493(+)